MKRSKPNNSSAGFKRQTAAQLRALQRLMAAAVMRPLTAKQRMRTDWPDGKSADNFIKPNKRLTAYQRLEIYNRQYWFRVLESFYDDYPGVQAVLGEERFHNLAIAYLANHPSTSFTLRNLGRHLAEFIIAEPKWAKPDEDLAVDMARLEWAHIEAFDNAAKPPLKVEDLQDREPSKLRLRLQPHVVLLELGWPLDDYLIALRENSRLRGEASNAVEDFAGRDRVRPLPAPKRRRVWLAVHRYHNMVYYKRLKPDQYALLSALQSGAVLESALSQVGPGRIPLIGMWFKDWAALGWFSLAR